MLSSRGSPIGVIVGIDIGLTCTGVSIYTGHDARDARLSVLQQWPGTKELASKVPTRVGYKAGEIGFDTWGFECPELENIGHAMGIKDMFKFYLDVSYGKNKFQRYPEGAPKLENVKMWYQHFLIALFTHITKYLRDRLRIAKSTPIEFIFSIPTAWKENDQLVQEFRKLVDKAGFGAAGNVIMELTEGEASAVFTAKLLGYRFKEGDAFVVCDAGGGTTDVCVLHVKRVQDEMVELENLADPTALGVGSVDIDDIFEARAQEQLRAMRGIPQQEVQLLAHQITRSDFQTLKTLFPDQFTTWHLPIPNSTERIPLHRDELKAIFDSQIKKIIEVIDKQIQDLKAYRPDLSLSYLFLAGGLGSSKYVQDEIVKHCKDLKVLCAPEPEDLPLAVCKGLVTDRLQQFSDHLPVIPIRSTNTSYGILCREIYSKKHFDQFYTKDQLDGKKYADNRIDWLLFKDRKPLRGESVTRSYTLLVDPLEFTESWGFTVVCSTLDANHLPPFLDGKGAKVLCHVTSASGVRLHDGGAVQKRVGLIGKKSVFYRVHCELSAIISLGKMEFTSRISGQGDDQPQSLTVDWPPIPKRHGDNSVLIRSCDNGL